MRIPVKQVFIELGVLICSITAMALLYTMMFLLLWLYLAGPRPIKSNYSSHLHRWDFVALIPFRNRCCRNKKQCDEVHTNNRPPLAIEKFM